MLRMDDMRRSQVPMMEMISIPASVFLQMYSDVQQLADMHQKLIDMYETESYLKKHHKAYLHVRDEADLLCLQDKLLMKEILKHYSLMD